MDNISLNILAKCENGSHTYPRTSVQYLCFFSDLHVLIVYKTSIVDRRRHDSVQIGEAVGIDNVRKTFHPSRQLTASALSHPCDRDTSFQARMEEVDQMQP